MDSWLVKVKRYGGGESVVSHHYSEGEAYGEVDRRNRAYQSNIYWVEKYDEAKAVW